jgi:hypothetical protein
MIAGDATGPRYGEGVAGPAVAVRGVRVGYGSLAVLQDVDLSVAGGEVVAVTGVNGAGKSTLLSFAAAGGRISSLGDDREVRALAGGDHGDRYRRRGRRRRFGQAAEVVCDSAGRPTGLLLEDAACAVVRHGRRGPLVRIFGISPRS